MESLAWLLEEPIESEDLAWDHAMEVSGSVYRRMKQLGMRNKDLAEKMGVSPARISHILKGEQSMTLTTLARLEVALDMNMSQGFSQPVLRGDSGASCVVIPFPGGERTTSPVCPQVGIVKVKEG